VTPVGPNEVCIAMIGSAREARLSNLPTLFPVLAKRLGGAEPTDLPRGAISMSVRLSAVTQGRVALVGDASGSVDAITGEGLALAFRQARFLATSLAAENLKTYDSVHRQIGRRPWLMARLLLLMDGSNGLRRRALRTLAARPRIFGRLLAFHVGALPTSELSVDVPDFSLRPVTSRTALRRSL
jgi:flavin-dependent dehydrogenase